MIKVLIVDDSSVVAELLTHVLSSDPAIHVLGRVPDGLAAVEATKRLKPDVITMDIHMPRMNGFDATREIMQTNPTPIVIVSDSSAATEVATTFEAIEAGALAVVRRPTGIGHPDHEAAAREFLQTVKLMSEVKVVKRWAVNHLNKEAAAAPPRLAIRSAPAEIQLVAVGASTGGPVVVQRILDALPKNFSVPVLIVQHIAAGFVEGFAEWLGQTSNLPVHIATHGVRALPGHTYLAPEDFHMGVDSAGRIALSKAEPENGLRPAVSHLFRSVANVFGQNAVGVLLTGMGRDGAEELKLLKDRDAVTIAQDKESSVVHGMPGEAISLGAATHVLPADKIAAALIAVVNHRAIRGDNQQ
jgi:two-component system chemotaxis response regulator CheB